MPPQAVSDATGDRTLRLKRWLAVMAVRPLAAAQKKDAFDALARLSGRPVDLIALQTTRGPLLRRILRTGPRLCCASDARCTELLKRHVFDQADFAPCRRRPLRERRERWIEAS